MNIPVKLSITDFFEKYYDLEWVYDDQFLFFHFKDKLKIKIEYDAISAYNFIHQNNKYQLVLEVKKLTWINNIIVYNKIVNISTNDPKFFQMINQTFEKNIVDFSLNTKSIPYWAVLYEKSRMPYNIRLRWWITFIMQAIPIITVICNLLFIYRDVISSNQIMKWFFNSIIEYNIISWCLVVIENSVIIGIIKQIFSVLKFTINCAIDIYYWIRQFYGSNGGSGIVDFIWSIKKIFLRFFTDSTFIYNSFNALYNYQCQFIDKKLKYIIVGIIIAKLFYDILILS